MDSADVLSSRRTTRNDTELGAGESFPYSRGVSIYENGFSPMVTEPVSRNTPSYRNTGQPFVHTVSLPSIYARGESRALLTRPKLLRKRESELGRCKELLLKKTADCANAVSGERFAIEREANLRRKLHDQRCEFEGTKRVERLRNRERLSFETQRLRREIDETKILLASRDAVVERLRNRVRQLEEVKKRKEVEIGQMRFELATKNRTLKNLLRKLVLAQFSKKK